MLHSNALIQKRTDALTRRDDRWNWKSRNFRTQRQRAAAFRQTWRAICWRWLTTLFVCMFWLPPFSIGTDLSFLGIATVQRRWITGSFHGYIDSEQGEVKMCFSMKSVVSESEHETKTRTPCIFFKHGDNSIPVLHTRVDMQMSKQDPRFYTIFRECSHPETHY